MMRSSPRRKVEYVTDGCAIVTDESIFCYNTYGIGHAISVDFHSRTVTYHFGDDPDSMVEKRTFTVVNEIPSTSGRYHPYQYSAEQQLWREAAEAIDEANYNNLQALQTQAAEIPQ